MGLVLFGLGEAVGAFLVLYFMSISVVVVLVLFQALVLVVGGLLGTVIGAVLYVTCCSSAEHVALSFIVGTDLIGLGLYTGLVGTKPPLVVKFRVLQQQVQELIHMWDIKLHNLLSRQSAHLYPQLIRNELNQAIQFLAVIHALELLELDQFD